MEKSKHRVSLIGLLGAAGVVGCLATFFGFFGGLLWFFDLFSHFRVQYFVVLLLLAAVMFWRRDRKLGWAFLLGSVINGVAIAPLFWGRSSLPKESGPRLRAMLINVHTDGGDPARVLAQVRAADPDFLVLQEISSRWQPMMAELKGAYPYALYQTREDNFGIGLWSKFPLEGTVEEMGEAMLPTVDATVSGPIGPLQILAVHPVPPGGAEQSHQRDQHLALLPARVRRGQPLLLLGDLNTTPWGASFRRLLQVAELRNSSRGFGVQPTWPSFAPALGIPLDHCLHSKEVAILDRRTGPHVGSDHLPLTVEFVISKR